jgi:hypothetical protein
MSTNTYNTQNYVMSVNEWITELDGEFNVEEYNILPENIEYCSIPSWNKDLPKNMQPNYGKPLTEKHKKKISEAGMGRVVSTETRKKISENNGMRGKVPANKGKPHTPETLNKMSKAMKQRWASGCYSTKKTR